MTEIFRLCGTAVTPDGGLLCNLRVAVVDEDTFNHDLLGVGFTDDQGCFRLSFTRREFNQDLFESEALPDIYIVFSALFDGVFKAVAVKRFPDLLFEGGLEDLGDVVLTQWRPEGFEPIEGADPTPGADKRVQRLDLDHDLVKHCLAEVTPLVESLTGWSGLLDDLKIDVTDELSRYVLGPVVEALGMSMGSLQGRVMGLMADQFADFLALYDPLTHTVVVHSQKAARQNLDALKVIIGHEMVHVGQFKSNPKLVERYKSMLAEVAQLEIFSQDDGSVDSEALAQAMRASPMQSVMEELEGFAYYIQRDFLEKHYNLATFFTHRSFIERLLTTAVRAAVPASDTIAEVKRDQYVDGAERFRQNARATGQPARFDSSTAPSSTDPGS